MYSVYDVETGYIKRTVGCPDHLLDANVMEDESAILGDYNNYIYRIDLSTHEAVEKSLIPFSSSKSTITADGIDEVAISNLPIDCTAEFEGEIQEVPDGVIEFATDVPGEYRIVLRASLYRDTVVEITAE